MNTQKNIVEVSNYVPAHWATTLLPKSLLWQLTAYIDMGRPADTTRYLSKETDVNWRTRNLNWKGSNVLVIALVMPTTRFSNFVGKIVDQVTLFWSLFAKWPYNRVCQTKIKSLQFFYLIDHDISISYWMKIQNYSQIHRLESANQLCPHWIGLNV